ncbi:MAG TPA: hypothetical protein VIY08_06235 [Candidatus Nitrosocosmicus sp.]
MIISNIEEPISEILRLCIVNKKFNFVINKFVQIEYKRSFKKMERTERELKRIQDIFKNKTRYDCTEISAGEEYGFLVDSYERDADTVFVVDEQLSEKRESVYVLVSRKDGNKMTRYLTYD